MSTREQTQARVFAQLRPFLPYLAALLAVLAVWLAWSGWRQLQDGTRRDSVVLARDTAAGITASTLAGDRKRLQERLADATVQAALQAGDLDAAAKALAADWPNLEAARILPPDLDPAYASLPDGGFGPLAAMEAALVQDAPVTAVIRVGGEPRVALAAPARVGDTLVGVACLQLPLSRATLGLESASVDPDTYVALRQGNFTLLERGDASQAEAAERMAVPVPGTDLRLAAAVPHVGRPPLGLSGLPLFVVAVGL